jgi:hypothetical protein
MQRTEALLDAVDVWERAAHGLLAAAGQVAPLTEQEFTARFQQDAREFQQRPGARCGLYPAAWCD